MIDAAYASRPVADAFWLCTRKIDELLQRGCLDIVSHNDHERTRGDTANRFQVFRWVVRQLLPAGSVRSDRAGNKQQGVAVGRRFGYEVGTDGAAGTAFVVNNDRLPQSCT